MGLAEIPIASGSGEILLLRKVGLSVLPLNALRNKLTFSWCSCSPGSGCGSSPCASRGRAAVGHTRRRRRWSSSVADGRSRRSCRSGPAWKKEKGDRLQVWGAGRGLAWPEASTGFDECFPVTLRNGAFLAGPAVRLNSSFRSMSSSRKTSSAGPSSTSSWPCTHQGQGQGH